MPLLLAVLALALALAAPAAPRAAEPDAALRAELLALFDAYNAAIRAGDVPKALALRDTGTRAQLEKAIRGERKRRQFLDLSRQMIPDRLDLASADLSGNGRRAELRGIALKTWPASQRGKRGVPADGVGRNELTLAFLNEGGAWKFVGPIFGFDPEKIKRCANEAFEPREAYEADRSASLGGRVLRVAFAEEHTLLIVRLVDEENCLYLPAREALRGGGFDTDLLKPGATVAIEAFPHRSDELKGWVDQITVRRQ